MGVFLYKCKNGNWLQANTAVMGGKINGKERHIMNVIFQPLAPDFTKLTPEDLLKPEMSVAHNAAVETLTHEQDQEIVRVRSIALEALKGKGADFNETDFDFEPVSNPATQDQLVSVRHGKVAEFFEHTYLTDHKRMQEEAARLLTGCEIEGGGKFVDITNLPRPKPATLAQVTQFYENAQGKSATHG